MKKYFTFVPLTSLYENDKLTYDFDHQKEYHVILKNGTESFLLPRFFINSEVTEVLIPVSEDELLSGTKQEILHGTNKVANEMDFSRALDCVKRLVKSTKENQHGYYWSVLRNIEIYMENFGNKTYFFIEEPPVSVKATLLLTLKSKSDWVRKCPDCLPEKNRAGEKFLFLDANDNVLESGVDFMHAEEIGSYPVRVYRTEPTHLVKIKKK